jgi:hypothetical protein
MAQTTTKTKKNANSTDEYVEAKYLDPQVVADVLGISLVEHVARTAQADYPKAVFLEGKFMGFSISDVQKYRDRELVNASEVVTQPVPEVKTAEVATPEIDPSVQIDEMQIPTTGLNHTLSLAFSAGFSTQWSSDDLLRWKKLICGLVRSNKQYISYQERERIIDVRSNIQDAMKWLLRTAVPLTQAELEYLNLHSKSLGDERAIEELTKDE